MSYLGLGHVFVANMTGNLVLLGFAAAGLQGVSLGASVVALAGFAVGAAVGRVVASGDDGAGRNLMRTFAVEAVCIGAATIARATHAVGPHGNARLALVALLAVAMGAQTIA